MMLLNDGSFDQCDARSAALTNCLARPAVQSPYDLVYCPSWSYLMHATTN